MRRILIVFALLAVVGLVQGLGVPGKAQAAEVRLIAKQVIILERGVDFVRTKSGVFRVNNATQVTVRSKRVIRFIDLTTPCAAVVRYEAQNREEPLLREIDITRTLTPRELRE